MYMAERAGRGQMASVLAYLHRSSSSYAMSIYKIIIAIESHYHTCIRNRCEASF